jgi:hypothetical protein
MEIEKLNIKKEKQKLYYQKNKEKKIEYAKKYYQQTKLLKLINFFD